MHTQLIITHKTIVIIRPSPSKWIYQKEILCAVTKKFLWCYLKEKKKKKLHKVIIKIRKLVFFPCKGG